MLFLKSKKGKKEFIKKNSTQNPKILEVNLIKGEVKISFDWKKNISLLVLVFIIAGAFVVEIYFGLDLWAKKEALKAEALTKEIEIITKDIKDSQKKADAALLYKNKSQEVSRLLANHIYWSTFFDWLEKNTLSSVKFASFEGSTDGKYTLEGTATRYQDVSWQVKALSDSSLVKKVEVLQVASADEDKASGAESENATSSSQKIVNFSLELEIDPVIFRK